jgi:hypothetical protein
MLALMLCFCWQEKDPATTKEAMQRVQMIVGAWRATFVSKGGKEENWQEKHEWEFRIEKDDYALTLKVTDARYLKEGVLTYDLKKKLYRLDAVRADGKKATFEGKLDGKALTLDEVVGKDASQERLEFNLLRDTRFLLSLERREAGRETFLMTHSIACQKEGVSIVKGDLPKCVVTGGSGIIPVTHGGKTYYVC